jgi:hypothetical protein
VTPSIFVSGSFMVLLASTTTPYNFELLGYALWGINTLVGDKTATLTGLTLKESQAISYI